MNNSLTGKIAAITSAASGIGLSCAKAMLEAGAKVVLVDKNENKLSQLCHELGANAYPLAIDLLDKEAVSEIGGGL